jgi:enoyl-CoA hydratase
MSHHLPTSAVLSIDFADHVATVWLDRAEAHNAMGPAFWTDLPTVMDALGAEPDVRVVVVAARGAHFTVGLDIKVFGDAFLQGGVDDEPAASEGARRQATYAAVKRMQHTFSAVAECPKPVIAAVHGYCLGGGMDLVTACDLRVASADAVFSVRETKMAIVADVGTLQRLPLIVGAGRVADLVYTGRDVDAAEADRIGLVDRLLPDRETMLAAAHDLALQIAANSPITVQGVKAALVAATRSHVEQGLDRVAVWNAAFLHSDDLAEAVTAFVERRPPRF